MPNKVPEKNKPSAAVEQPPAPPQPAFALLFQLEEIAVEGRRMMYEVLCDLFGESKKKMTVPLFARYCLQTTPQAYVAALIETLGAKKPTAERLVEELSAGLAGKLAAATIKLSPSLLKVLEATKAYPASIGAVTLLPDGVGDALHNRLGLAELGVRLLSFKDDQKPYPGPDIWLKTAKAMSQRPRNCSVLASSTAVCKSALSADMRCVVVPDEFTSFQDYSGANIVLEKLDEISTKELLATLFPLPAPAMA
jgi:beta-phosphoglucomutase-like phosphatase (HAD superfamily)